MLFVKDRRTEGDAASRRTYALFEIAYTLVDFGAAVCFTIGSVLFFWKAYEPTAIWLFTIGSLLFLAKPTIRLVREVTLYEKGDYADLAKRVEDN